ncbi:unnamed protein product [Adineta steineri]|uniref:Uncharacterized protein n=2 Tax=Adineta steineri TaxID=433720 RepID=A0A814RM74_9BILA|nr:unnamed protein product [Adineta steineri]CAF1391869.1 unnamed protein product [Adineta steineri]
MTSDFPNEMSPSKLDTGQVRLSTPSTNRRFYKTSHHQRHNLHTRRAATIDPETNEEKLRIVVLGATKVGKTCLCQQFLQQKFLPEHKETVDEMYRIELSLVDRRIILEILDTAGIDEFPVMRRIAIAHGDAFLIMYAVNDTYSFDIAQQMRQLVYEIKGDSETPIPMVIVANKCDLDIERREITRDYAETIVRDQWKSTLIETTCHERESVLNTFRVLLHLANVNMTFSPEVPRRSSDPSVSENRQQRTTNKRNSCAQQ